jgi:YegS/Rv2252/BmrU family lipid kinase
LSEWLAVVNPAAGGGRAGAMAAAAIDQLRAAGLQIRTVTTRQPGHAVQLAREAYGAGTRRFLAAGGDGTAYEIVNGVFPESCAGGRVTLGLLPLGTGNSFLRDFSTRGPEYAMEALAAGRTRSCDVLRVVHDAGAVYFINLLSVGFAADVAFDRARRFRGMGQLGYFLAIFTRLARLERRAFPVRVDAQPEFDRRRCLFLTFNNSKFTGGTMMIAPDADPCDGLIEYVRWGPIGRLGLLWNLRRLYDGTHVRHPQATRKSARRVEFNLDGSVNVMIDGEVERWRLKSIEVLPGAIDVAV